LARSIQTPCKLTAVGGTPCNSVGLAGCGYFRLTEPTSTQHSQYRLAGLMESEDYRDHSTRAEG